MTESDVDILQVGEPVAEFTESIIPKAGIADVQTDKFPTYSPGSHANNLNFYEYYGSF